ncbi:MAG: hypothetical protein QM749_17860 [Aquabacterium sp.]
MNTTPPARPVPAHARQLAWLCVIACLITGSLQEIMSLSDTVYWLNLLVMSAVAVYALLRCIFTPVTVTLWDYFASMIGMMYGLGTLNTEISGIQSFRDLAMLTTAPPLYIHETLGCVALLMSALLLIGQFSRHKLLDGLTPDWLDPFGILVFGTLTAGVCVVLVATGTIGYHGNLLSDESITPSPAATYAIFCSTPAAAGLVYMWRRYTQQAKLVAGLSLLVFLAVNLYLGRRNVTYNMIVCAMAYFGAIRNQFIFTRQTIIAMVSAAALVPIVTTGFMAMRMASYETPAGQKPTVGKIVVAAIDIIQQDKSEVNKQSAENLKDRTYLIGYLSELAWRTEVYKPLYGDLFLYNVAMSIPNAIWPSKFSYVRTGSEEALSHPLLGMATWDAANSVLTTGMTDFGPVGMVLYPLGIGALYAWLLTLIRKLDTSIFLLMSFSFLQCLANIESQMLGYFTFLRDVILVSLILFAIVRTARFFRQYNEAPSLVVKSRPNDRQSPLPGLSTMVSRASSYIRTRRRARA